MTVTQNAPRLIVSFDVGTTQSAIAVAYLTPGQTPFVSGVDRWPGQEEVIYEAKVPTAVLYDDQGRLIACGAEAVNVDMTNRMASQPAWSQPEHFKMQLHPGNTLSRDDRDRTRRNPDAVPLSRVYADYLAYLLKHTRSYLTDAFGYDVWLELEDRVEIALSHPNRWGAREQGFLQNAAVRAGLITKNGAAQRLHFVEEAEAAACFAIGLNPVLAAELEAGAKFVVCDAGGSTIDISAYCVNRTSGPSVDVEELELPSCLDAGGIHVDKELVMHLYEQLYHEDDFQEDDTNYLHDIVNDGRKDFQNFGKRKFSSPNDSLSVRVGGRRMTYPGINLTRGVMNIASPTSETFFKPFVEQAIETVYGLVERHGIRIIILTGGFSESPYFKSMIENHLGSEGKTVILANHPTCKAVAMGALRLIAGGNGSMTVKRKKRPWHMWLTNFGKGVKEFLT